MVATNVIVPIRAVLSVVIVLGASSWATPSYAFNDEFSDSTLDARWNWTDPLQDCWYSLTLNPGNLRIHVPSGNHDLYAYSNLNAPRVTQPVSGDFSVETKVICAPAHDAQAAGLLVWQDSDNYLRFDRLLHYQNRQVVDLSGERGGSWYYFAEGTYVGTTTHLQLERTEDTFTATFSIDGTAWIPLATVSFPLLDAVGVGLFVLNQWQDNPFQADFDYFRSDPLVIVLHGKADSGQLLLRWTALQGTADYWVYGASNQPYFNPGFAPGYLHRLSVIAPPETTWSSSNGVGDPNVNWTYMVLAVDGGEQELVRSNRFGEHDFGMEP